MTHFFCTAGRGTEAFLVEELKGIGCHNKIEKTDGKIFFSADGRNTSLLDLKCAERLFIQVLHLPNQRFSNNKDIQRLGKLIADCDLWDTVVDSYRALAPQGKDQNDKKFLEPPSKKPRSDISEDTPDSAITFRISCKLSSAAGRQLEPQAVSRAIGWHVRQTLNWQVNTRQPLLEVCVHIGGQGVTVGIPVTSKPLSQRTYLQDFGLRSTVAWIMGKLANIKPGKVVLDPMCGAGTILVEAQHSWPEAQYIGVDTCPKQLQRAQQNVKFSGKTDDPCLIELLIGNSEYLPIKSNSVDCVICDLPFGNRYLTVSEVRKLFPLILQEFNRVLRPGGNVVLLISTTLKEDLLQQVAALTPAIHQGALEEPTKVAPPTASSVKEPCSDSHTEPPVQLTETSGDLNEIAQVPCTISTEINTLQSNSSVLNSRKEKDICPLEGSSEQYEHPSQNSCTTTQAWSVDRVHYLKLGETHSQLCVFTKLHL